MSFNPWISMIIMLYPFPGAFYRGDGWGPGRVRAGPRDRLGPGGLDLRGQGPGPGPGVLSLAAGPVPAGDRVVETEHPLLRGRVENCLLPGLPGQGQGQGRGRTVGRFIYQSYKTKFSSYKNYHLCLAFFLSLFFFRSILRRRFFNFFYHLSELQVILTIKVDQHIISRI